MNLSTVYQNAMSYDEYVDELGEYLSLHLLHYKKFSLDPQQISRIENLSPARILVITEPWCADSLALLPIVCKIAELNGRWNIRILRRDSNQDLMDNFLTNGSKAIPLFLFLDAQGEIIFRWGPRPKVAKLIFDAHRNQIEKGELKKSDVIKKIRTFYAKDRGNTTTNELLEIFDHYLNRSKQPSKVEQPQYQ